MSLKQETGWKSSDSFNQSQLRRAIYMLSPKTRKLITFANERFLLVSWLLCKSLNSSWQVSKSVKVLLNWKNFKMEIHVHVTWLTCNQIPVVSYIFKGFLQRKECCISQKYTAWSCSWQITQDYPLYCSPSFYSKTKRVRGIVRQKLKTTQSSEVVVYNSFEWTWTTLCLRNDCSRFQWATVYRANCRATAYSIILFIYCVNLNQCFKDEHALARH